MSEKFPEGRLLTFGQLEPGRIFERGYVRRIVSDSRRIFPVLSLIKKRWIFFSEYIVEVFNHGDVRKFERIP